MKMLQIAVLLIAGAISSNAMAAGSTGTADARIIRPISIIVEEDWVINFGGFVSGTPGTIDVDPILVIGGDPTKSVGTPSPGLQMISTNYSVDMFLVTGEPNFGYTMTIDPTVTLSNGTSTMTATTNGLSSITGGFPNSTLNNSGFDILHVGGTLTIVGNETPGSYVGSYLVSVDY